MNDINHLGQRFSSALTLAKHQADEIEKANISDEKIHVVGAGGMVTAAYEQLRNAAEYADEHLLLQKAIKRFYRRTFLTQSAEFIAKSANELVTELTFAGYIPNDSVTEAMTRRINQLAVEYHHVYLQIQTSRNVSNLRGETWAIDVFSVEVSQIFRPQPQLEAFAQFAFDHFKNSFDFSGIFTGTVPADVEPALYVAVHRALLKSDLAMIRTALLHRYKQSPSDFAGYCRVNAEINKLFDSDTTELLVRIVDRQGAPLRIVERMLERRKDLPELLNHKTRFLNAFESQIQSEYSTINKRINRGIIKSVFFLIITKFLVGIAIEVPYDLWVRGHIFWLPLIVNLFFPPVYMVFLRATLALPSNANTVKLVAQADTMFYGSNTPQLYRLPKSTFGAVYNFAYALFFIVVFGGVSWLLVHYAQFEMVHLVIFFVFLSGASFLGFRLSRMIRELESVDSQQNSLTVLRDFLYMPFVVVGRWMSEKYAQVNFVSMILDMVIELPLKTVLRMIRQWSAFISSKKDQL